MLNPVYFIVNEEVLTEFNSSSVLALRIDILDRDKLITTYKKLQKLNYNASFCLYISVGHVVDELCIFDLVSFFFLPKYYSEGNAPMVILTFNDHKDKEAFSWKLAHAAGQQGIAQLAYHFLPQQQLKTAQLFNANEIEKIKMQYINELNSISGKTLYITADTAAAIKEIEEALNHVESEFVLENEVLYNCKIQNKILEKKLERAESLLEAAESEIKSMTSHIIRLQSTSPTASLQNYYNKEYEVLPRWYKQFGHILKVIMGKRTFGSLFNDRLKKYKA